MAEGGGISFPSSPGPGGAERLEPAMRPKSFFLIFLPPLSTQKFIAWINYHRGIYYRGGGTKTGEARD